MSKPVLAYVGHSYHRTTSSTAFFLEILAQHYDVSIIWDDSWQPSGQAITAKQINSLKPKTVVFFQTMPSLGEFLKIRCTSKILVPMHDYIVGNPHIDWTVILPSGIRLINFCHATHEYFVKLGFQSLAVQYWPQPQAAPPAANHDCSVFFWIRKREVGWPLLKTLLGSMRPNQILLRIAPDPREEIELPSAEDMNEYRIEIIRGWLDKARYMELLESCQIYMAPRLYEGIGQSFLEAMAHGLAVIAPDNPTMNEYIKHGCNGYLYSPTEPGALDFSIIQTVRAQAHHDVGAGHHNWLTQQQNVLDYMHSRSSSGPNLLWRIRGLLGR